MSQTCLKPHDFDDYEEVALLHSTIAALTATIGEINEAVGGSLPCLHRWRIARELGLRYKCGMTGDMGLLFNVVSRDDLENYCGRLITLFEKSKPLLAEADYTRLAEMRDTTPAAEEQRLTRRVQTMDVQLNWRAASYKRPNDHHDEHKAALRYTKDYRDAFMQIGHIVKAIHCATGNSYARLGLG